MDLDVAGNPLSGSARALIAHTLLGKGLPREAEDHMWQAGLSYHLDAIAEKHLHQAQALAPGHAAVLIGLYRFYFYKGRLSEALEIARPCITQAALENGLAYDWRQVKAADAAFGSYESILPRFYLFSLNGLCLLADAPRQSGRRARGHEKAARTRPDRQDRCQAPSGRAEADRATMTDDIDEARDCQGHEVNCSACTHLSLKKTGGCRLMHACVNDHYARHNDRFFNWSPALANAYTAHPHFEVRAITAKHVNLFLLLPLLNGAEEAVRANAARRLLKSNILTLRNDSHREMKILVATLLDGEELVPMLSDQNYCARQIVARRAATVAEVPAALRCDPDWRVRREVVTRIAAFELARLTENEDSMVQEVARRRLACKSARR